MSRDFETGGATGNEMYNKLNLSIWILEHGTKKRLFPFIMKLHNSSCLSFSSNDMAIMSVNTHSQSKHRLWKHCRISFWKFKKSFKRTWKNMNEPKKTNTSFLNFCRALRELLFTTPGALQYLSPTSVLYSWANFWFHLFWCVPENSPTSEDKSNNYKFI